MDRKIDEYEHFARENAKDIVALGFDPERTFIFSDYGFMGNDFYRNITRVAKVRSLKLQCGGRYANPARGSVEGQQMPASASTPAQTLERYHPVPVRLRQ
jgi:tryptophanyl-tRNA synthetase